MRGTIEYMPQGNAFETPRRFVSISAIDKGMKLEIGTEVLVLEASRVKEFEDGWKSLHEIIAAAVNAQWAGKKVRVYVVEESE